MHQFISYQWFRLLDIAIFWFYYVSLFLVAKIMSQDLKIRLKESTYIVLASLCLTVYLRFPRVAFMFTGVPQWQHPHFSFFVRTVFVLSLALRFIYFKWIKSYPAIKAVVLTCFTGMFAYITISLVAIMYRPFNFTPLRIGLARTDIWLAISSTLLILVLSAPITFLAVKLSGKIRKQINASYRMQLALMIGAVIAQAMFYAVQFLGFGAGGISTMLSIVLIGYFAASLVSFVVYIRFLNTKHALAQKEEEQRYLQFYASEMEQQQLAIRKFKHDQQNLFAAIGIYIKNNDLEGLKEFYPNVRTASEVITKNEFELEGLGRIKKQEIKNIFIAKLVVAQNLGIDIKLEIREEINDIEIDSVAMVRMLGIILDNAIEELQTLDRGELIVACINAESHKSITVQNTCRRDIPPLKQLKQSGFSTKGEGRGLGLSNLYELIDTLPNVSLMTSIDSGNFTQTLTIER